MSSHRSCGAAEWTPALEAMLQRICLSGSELSLAWHTPHHYSAELSILPSMTVSSIVRAGWWYRPEFIIMELNINAAITSPAHDESVPLTPEPYTVRGYAYSGAPSESCSNCARAGALMCCHHD